MLDHPTLPGGITMITEETMVMKEDLVSLRNNTTLTSMTDLPQQDHQESYLLQ